MLFRMPLMIICVMGIAGWGCVDRCAAEDKQPDAVESADQPDGKEPKAATEWECYVTAQCRDEFGTVIFSEEIPGMGSTEELALDDALMNCADFDCSVHEVPGVTGPLTLYCCQDNSAPCVEPQCQQVPTKSAITTLDKVGEDDKLSRFEYSALANDGKPLSVAGLKDRNKVWERFQSLAQQRGGIVPGSLRYRRSTPFLFRCYTRVRWQTDDAIQDIEVEGKSDGLDDARARANHVAAQLIELLGGGEIVPGRRRVRTMNTRYHLCHEAAVSRVQCDTHEGPSIIATRYGRDQRSACAAAQAAAVVLADAFGGVVEGSCEEIRLPTPTVEKKAGAAGCCGN